MTTSYFAETNPYLKTNQPLLFRPKVNRKYFRRKKTDDDK